MDVRFKLKLNTDVPKRFNDDPDNAPRRHGPRMIPARISPMTPGCFNFSKTRLKIFAKKADQEELPQMAKLFRVISFSEEIHGERALRMLREIKDTDTNIKESFQSETSIAGVAYEEFLELAENMGDTTSSIIFSNSRDVEEGHAKLYKMAINHLIGERETTYYVCQVCGYVADGVCPETCPVCSAPKDQFVEFK